MDGAPTVSLLVSRGPAAPNPLPDTALQVTPGRQRALFSTPRLTRPRLHQSLDRYARSDAMHTGIRACTAGFILLTVASLTGCGGVGSALTQPGTRGRLVDAHGRGIPDKQVDVALPSNYGKIFRLAWMPCGASRPIMGTKSRLPLFAPTATAALPISSDRPLTASCF